MCQVFCARWASFGQLCIICDPHINFLTSLNGLNDHKEPETMNYIRVTYEETFYVRHTALTPAVVTINSDDPWQQWKYSGLVWLGFIEFSVFNANSVDPDQTPRSAAPDLGLHCLPLSVFVTLTCI